MLQKDDFFCHRTLLFSSSAWNPLHGKNEAIWCCYLVFFTIISSASDYLSLVKKTNLIWEPESDGSGKRCCAVLHIVWGTRAKIPYWSHVATQLPRSAGRPRAKGLLFFSAKSLHESLFAISLAGIITGQGSRGNFFSDLIPDRSPFVINIETAFQSHAVKFFDNGNQVHCYIVHSLRTWEQPIGDPVQKSELISRMEMRLLACVTRGSSRELHQPYWNHGLERTSGAKVCFWLDETYFQPIRNTISTHTSSVWNFCTRFSDVILRGNQWWHLEMSAVFSG